MTIEERAKDIVCKKCKCHTYEDAIKYIGKTYVEAIFNSVLDALKLQQKADIDKAWNFIRKNFDASILDTNGYMGYGPIGITEEQFRKAMEE